MNFYVMTLFPEIINAGTNYSILKRARENNRIDVYPVNIRDFADNKHNRVDDSPYGGGAGMVIQAPPVYHCYKHVSKLALDARVVYLSPQGKVFTQDMAREFANERELILLCGHYEGIDERVIEEIVTDEVSIGDYVLTGGELAALVLIDAISRFVPGVLGKEQSADDESFSGGLLEYPQYTRPAEFLGRGIPEVLLSGHHGNVDRWRHEMRLKRTADKRPDILKEIKK